MKRRIEKEAWWYRRSGTHTAIGREREKLAQVAAVCDAWNQFFQLHTRRLARIKGYLQWFNEHQYFKTSYIDVECSEAALQKTLAKMVFPGVIIPKPIRRELFDSRAWVEFPLSSFVSIPEKWAPSVQFGLAHTPWEVSSECFSLSHNLKADWPGASSRKRFAVLTFNHPQLHPRFNGCAWVAEQTFPREATRQELLAEMMQAAEETLQPYLVTIQYPPKEAK